MRLPFLEDVPLTAVRLLVVLGGGLEELHQVRLEDVRAAKVRCKDGHQPPALLRALTVQHTQHAKLSVTRLRTTIKLLDICLVPSS